MQKPIAINGNPVALWMWWGYLCFVLVAHAMVVSHTAWTRTPNVDEMAHVAAGLYHWQTGKLDVYRVNPPIVRMAATWFLREQSPVWPTHSLLSVSSERIEWRLGERLLDAWTLDQTRINLYRARLMNLFFSFIGAIYVARWATDLGGKSSGAAAITLWSFCPNLSSWTATVCPDVAAAGLVVAGAYHWRQFLNRSVEESQTGSMLWTLSLPVLATTWWTGWALLTKSTCLALPMIYGWMLAWTWTHPIQSGQVARSRWMVAVRWMMWIGVTVAALGMLAGGYRGEGWGQSVDELALAHPFFQSSATDGTMAWKEWIHLSDWRIPLPEDYVRGIDLQLADFRAGRRSYWNGLWSDRGWWWYYVAAASVKMPLGCLVLFALQGFRLIVRMGRRRLDSGGAYNSDESRLGTRWRQEFLYLAIPFVAFLCLVSSQTGFGQHLRYAFPCWPWFYVGLSEACARRCGRWTNRFAWICVVGVVASSLSVIPRGHSYFHEAVGGPRAGSAYLLGSNLEWGEDLYDVERWIADHLTCRPVYRALYFDEFARKMTIPWHPADPTRLLPGWYVVSAERVLDPQDPFHFLASRKPIATIGYGVRVYDLTTDSSRCGIGRLEMRRRLR